MTLFTNQWLKKKLKIENRFNNINNNVMEMELVYLRIDIVKMNIVRNFNKLLIRGSCKKDDMVLNQTPQREPRKKLKKKVYIIM